MDRFEYDGKFRWLLDENGERIRGTKEIKCCGEWMYCEGFTNTCEVCGADYNWAGQRLAPRSQWGEETGESLSDILSVDGSDPKDLFE